MFFVPSNISAARTIKPPTSPALRVALRRLGIKRWGELHGLSKTVVRQQDSQGDLLVSELESLFEKARQELRPNSAPIPPCWPFPSSSLELLKSIPVENIPWSRRALHVIRRFGCKSLADIVAIPKPKWQKCWNVGARTLLELEKKIAAFLATPPWMPETVSSPTCEVPLQIWDNLLSWSLSPHCLEFLKSVPVGSIAWSVRAGKALRRSKCRSLGDVAMRSRSEWAECRNVGETTLNEIEKNLRSLVDKAQKAGAQRCNGSTSTRRFRVAVECPTDGVRVFWKEIQRALVPGHYADKLVLELAMNWGIRLRPTRRPLRVREVLKHGNLKAFLRDTRGIGKKRVGGIAETLWRAWAEAVPDGPAGPPPPPAAQVAASLLTNLGRAASTTAAIEAAMGNTGLGKKERQILRLRYGLSGQAPMNLDQVGALRRVSGESIRQLEAKAVAQLRGNAVSRAMLQLLLDRRIPEVLAALRRASGGELIRNEVLSWSSLSPADAFLVRVLHNSMPAFIKAIAPSTDLTRTPAGWWSGELAGAGGHVCQGQEKAKPCGQNHRKRRLFADKKRLVG